MLEASRLNGVSRFLFSSSACVYAQFKQRLPEIAALRAGAIFSFPNNDTADFPWTPLWPQWVPFLQVPILLAGLYYGLRGLHKVGRQIFTDPAQLHRSLVPPAALLVGVTLVFLKLFIG